MGSSSRQKVAAGARESPERGKGKISLFAMPGYSIVRLVELSGMARLFVWSVGSSVAFRHCTVMFSGGRGDLVAARRVPLAVSRTHASGTTERSC